MNLESLIDFDWINRLAQYGRLFVGFSGGLDSTVLLHHLAQQPRLINKLAAVHIHHGLSVHADAWVTHCQQVSNAFGIPLVVQQIEFDRRANIEDGARVARYQAFSSLLSERDCLLLAHHSDDQAETVLLHLLRGAGVDGLAAMPALKTLGKGELARPLLHHLRQTLEDYAQLHQLSWIDDESNQSLVFSRNYLRHQIMPLLRAKWPGVSTNLVACANHCQQAKKNLDELAALDCDALAGDRLPLALLQTKSHARLVNLLRVWLRNNHVRRPSSNTLNRLIDEVILAREDRVPSVHWDTIVIRRYRKTLYLLQSNVMSRTAIMEWSTFPARLQLGEEGASLCAIDASQGLRIPMGSRLQVRFRQGGELFQWHGQTKTLKKLLQQWGIPPWQRDAIPLVYINDCLAAVVGFAISDLYYGEEGSKVYEIRVSQSPYALLP